MAWVLSYRLFADGCDAAVGLCASLADAVRRRAGRLWLTLTADLGDSEDRWSPNVRGPLPGSLFDARYTGLAGDAARLDAAICRRQCMRRRRRPILHGVCRAKPR